MSDGENADRAPLRFGDIASGEGFIGEVVELPSGQVGLALFAAPGQQRRIVFVEGAKCGLVTRADDWRRLPERAREVTINLYERAGRATERSWER